MLADDAWGLPKLPALRHPWVDSTLSPLYETTWPVSSSEADIQGYMDSVNAWIVRLQSPWSSVFDFSSFDARTSTAAQRRLFINESRESVSLIEQHCAGFAVVAPSPLVRGVITAIRWFITEPCPVKVVATRAEAHQWCSDQLLAWAQQPPSREPVESFAE